MRKKKEQKSGKPSEKKERKKERAAGARFREQQKPNGRHRSIDRSAALQQRALHLACTLQRGSQRQTTTREACSEARRASAASGRERVMETCERREASPLLQVHACHLRPSSPRQGNIVVDAAAAPAALCLFTTIPCYTSTLLVSYTHCRGRK